MTWPLILFLVFSFAGHKPPDHRVTELDRAENLPVTSDYFILRYSVLIIYFCVTNFCVFLMRKWMPCRNYAYS